MSDQYDEKLIYEYARATQANMKFEETCYTNTPEVLRQSMNFANKLHNKAIKNAHKKRELDSLALGFYCDVSCLGELACF